MRKFALILPLFLNIAYAQPPPNPYTNMVKQVEKIGKQLKSEVEKPRRLSNLETVIFTDKKLFELLEEKRTDFVFFAKRFENLYLASYPKPLFYKSSVNIYLHSGFITKVILNGNFKIENIIASDNKFKLLNFSDNLILLQPKEDLTVVNLEVFVNHNGKKEVFEILVNNVNPQLNRYKNFVLYRTYILYEPMELKPYQVLDFYYSVYKKLPKKPVIISIGGVRYRIIPNPRIANVSIKDKDFFVSRVY